VDTSRPSPRTNRTRRVPHPVLIGRARQALADGRREPRDAGARRGAVDAAARGLQRWASAVVWRLFAVLAI
jgi:hypothetical protein